MHYACRHPEKISGMILVSSSPADKRGQNAFDEALSWKIQQTSGKVSQNIRKLSSLKDFQGLNTSEIESAYKALFSLYMSNPEFTGKLNLRLDPSSARSGFAISQKMSWVVPGFNLLEKLTTQLKRIPTLIVHGLEDVIPPWASEDIAWAIANSKLVTLENCGHFPHIEAPEEFLQNVNSFLDEYCI
mmetsp:Transcript_21578/g.30211  ORF Transcript_21578/g.30211 Transcript_21578/m.30211 type:complete len:187 (+) Transcript_21578:171-731(+)